MNTSSLNTLLPLLDKLGEQVENALITPDGISLLEKDRLKETLRRFYDAVDQIPVVKNETATAAGSVQHSAPAAAPASFGSLADSVIATLHSHSTVVRDIPAPAPAVSEASVHSAATAVKEADTSDAVKVTMVDTTISDEAPAGITPELPAEIPVVIAVQQEPVVVSIQPEPVVVTAQPEPTVIPAAPLAPKAPIEEKVVETRTKHLYAAAMYEEQSTVAAKYTAPETLGDKVTRESSTRRLSDQLKASPLADLKSSIGINERFAFINELFSGDQPAYLHSIEQINKMQTYQEAQSFLHEQLLKQYQWKPQSERFLQFDELVKRRFNA
ncbi:MAG: hypothetical protein U0Y08_10850 [Bacteroidia bacterium]